MGESTGEARPSSPWVATLCNAIVGTGVRLDRRELSFTVNIIPPTLVDTPMDRKAEAAGDFPGVGVVGPMVPLGRAGTQADIASACSFLCSDGGSYITGQVIGVNGGMSI
jgi:NAD(P)-dependent dehydrogenase (short-subunit alcohol dehydrogenase family)